MALRQITCPHCEEEVEVDVTSVTRSRDCPNCGKSILLERVSTQKRSKRTAVAVPSVDPVEKLGQASHAAGVSPQALEGHAQDRMMNDPEVRQNLRRLIWGTGILLGVIVLLCALDRVEWSSQVDQPQQESARSAPVTTTLVPASDSASLVKPDTKSLDATAPSRSPLTSPVSPGPAPVPNAAPPSTEAAPAVAAAKPPPSDDERAMGMVRAFLNAKNVDERLLTVRDVASMEPIIRAYYAGHPDGPIPFTDIFPVRRLTNDSRILKFDVKMPKGEKRRATAGRSNSVSAEYRVDWASFVIRSEMDWDDFLLKRSTGPVFMRVFMEPTSNSSADFPNTNYLCVKLTNPLNPASPPIFAYVGRDSALEKSLNLMLRIYAGDPYAVRLMLKHPAQAQSGTHGNDQVLLDQLVGEGWLSTAPGDFR